MNMISINIVDMRKLDEHNQWMRWAKMLIAKKPFPNYA